MTHNHKHACCCDHEHVSFCKRCRIVHCTDCGREWVDRCTLSHSYLPWYTYTYTGQQQPLSGYAVPRGNLTLDANTITTGIEATSNAAEPTACRHERH